VICGDDFEGGREMKVMGKDLRSETISREAVV
jgi:hypothetical protein